MTHGLALATDGLYIATLLNFLIKGKSHSKQTHLIWQYFETPTKQISYWAGLF